jgi:nucleotide-binding universal stress UspA family protein
MADIVVGVDGSPGSIAALAWARRESTIRGCTLRLVSAWTYPYLAALPGPERPWTPEELRSEARDTAEQALAAIGVAADDPAVQIRVAQGSASHVLTDASEDADLLVVGARGLGPIRGAVMGSVTLHCLVHAACPVVVVRTHEAEDAIAPEAVAGA